MNRLFDETNKYYLRFVILVIMPKKSISYHSHDQMLSLSAILDSSDESP